jgi:methionyl-tRNA formyltransferase
MSLRIVFMGTPEFAVPTLLALASRHHVQAVYTRAPKPAGRRGMEVKPSPVEREARRLGVPVIAPPSLRTAEAQALAHAHQAEAAVVVAFGLILPKPLLDAFSLGAFNLHASLLPRWRGAAPIARAIIAGDSMTGVMVMKMDEGLDTGPVAMSERVAIEPDATAGDVSKRLSTIGADLMLRGLDALEHGVLTLTPQPQGGATYADKIGKDEARIDWAKPWQEVHNQMRGLSPFPGAWFELPGPGTRVKVLRSTQGEGTGEPGTVLDHKLTIACGDGSVRLVELQRAGRQAMQAGEFQRGTPVAAGTQLP